MGYPVYARIGNLDVDIRNSNGIGGGELVGWLPIVGLIISKTSLARLTNRYI
jgi:hypothetical protein